MRKLCILFIALGITELPLLAGTPWSLFEDFSTTNQYGGLDNWDQTNDSTSLDIWPDWNVGNQTLLNNQLSYVANNENEQDGIMFLRAPRTYTTNGVVSNWRITQNTPLHYSSWSAQFKVNLNPGFVASNTNGIVEGGLLVRNFWSGSSLNPTKQGYWTAFGIDANGRKYLATDMFGSGTSSDYYFDATIASSELYIKVVFDFNLLSITSYFTEDLGNPGYFWSNPFRSESIESWGDQHGYVAQNPNDYDKLINIGFGGYSANTTVPDGTVTMDDFSFNLVPEPSALSLLAIGLGIVLRRRRRTI